MLFLKLRSDYGLKLTLNTGIMVSSSPLLIPLSFPTAKKLFRDQIRHLSSLCQCTWSNQDIATFTPTRRFPTRLKTAHASITIVVPFSIVRSSSVLEWKRSIRRVRTSDWVVMRGYVCMYTNLMQDLFGGFAKVQAEGEILEEEGETV